MRYIDRYLRALSSAGVTIALLFSVGAAAHAETNLLSGGGVALAYDSSTGTILKGYAQALYQSHDDGRTWEKIEIAARKDGQISSVAVSRARRGVRYIAGPGLGVLRTENAGKDWIEVNEGLPSRDVVAIAAHTTEPATVYAVVKDQGIYRSQDSGKSWRLMSGGPQKGMRQLIHSNMAGSMQTGWLFAATATGIRRVSDCFCLWQDIGKFGTQAYSITYDAEQPNHIYAATQKGLFHSADQGKAWSEMNAPSSKVVALVSARSDFLFVIDADGRLYRSADQGRTWERAS